jgi:hypothetical protein
VFKVFFIAFIPAVTIAIIAVFTNWLVPDTIFDDPAYSSKYVGVKELIDFVKTIDTADYYATLGTAIISGISYILVKLGF